MQYVNIKFIARNLIRVTLKHLRIYVYNNMCYIYNIRTVLCESKLYK